MHMVQFAHLGREHVKVRTGGTCKSQENLGGYLRSGDYLKKLENSSSCREVHMYGTGKDLDNGLIVKTVTLLKYWCDLTFIF